MVRTNENLEVIVQVLAYIAAQFCRDDSGGHGIVTMNPIINSSPGEEDTHFRAFGGRFTLLGLALPKIRDYGRGCPDRVVQCAVQLWRTVNARCFCRAWPFLGNRAGSIWKTPSACTAGRKYSGCKESHEDQPGGTRES